MRRPRLPLGLNQIWTCWSLLLKLEKCILLSRQIHFEIFQKYILQPTSKGACDDPGCHWGLTRFGLADLFCSSWTNIFCFTDKYILQLGQIHFMILTNTFYTLTSKGAGDDLGCHWGLTRFGLADLFCSSWTNIWIWKNTFWNLDKYIL